MTSSRTAPTDRGATTDAALLDVRHLTVSFPARTGRVTVAKDVSFVIQGGETLGLVGESGSGKSVTSLAIMGLIPRLGGRIEAGEVYLNGKDLLRVSAREWPDIRGREIGMIFQHPTRSLNPSITVGEQIAETVRRHFGCDRGEAWQRAVDALERVHISDAVRRVHHYPHQFSGGMCQRVMIAIAIVCEPSLLIADEPTTALDVTIQAQVLDLLSEIQRDTDVGILLITHDLAVVSQVADRVVVMYGGEVVERGTNSEIFDESRHPYTMGLLASVPQAGVRGAPLHGIPGLMPPPDMVIAGCRFHPRCPCSVEGECTTLDLAIQQLTSSHGSRCVRASKLDPVSKDR